MTDPVDRLSFHKPPETDAEIAAEAFLSSERILAAMRRLGARALVERQCMRQALRRAVRGVVAAAFDGTEPAQIERMVERMHLIYVQLLIYTGRVVEDWNLLAEDERFRDECHRAAMAAVQKRLGRNRARAMERRVATSFESTHPEHAEWDRKAKELVAQ
jgi:hypothetical protein